MYAISQLVSDRKRRLHPFALRLKDFLNWLTYVRASFIFVFNTLFSNFICIYHLFKIVFLSVITPLHNSWIIPTLTPESDVSDSVHCKLSMIDFTRGGGAAALICFWWKPKGSQQRKEEIIMISRIRSGKLWSFKKWRTWKYFKWITRHLFGRIWRIMQIWRMLHTSAITPSSSSVGIIPDQ